MRGRPHPRGASQQAVASKPMRHIALGRCRPGQAKVLNDQGPGVLRGEKGSDASRRGARRRVATVRAFRVAAHGCASFRERV